MGNMVKDKDGVWRRLADVRAIPGDLRDLNGLWRDDPVIGAPARSTVRRQQVKRLAQALAAVGGRLPAAAAFLARSVRRTGPSPYTSRLLRCLDGAIYTALGQRVAWSPNGHLVAFKGVSQGEAPTVFPAALYLASAKLHNVTGGLVSL